jgi:molybdopterin-binding protein
LSKRLGIFVTVTFIETVTDIITRPAVNSDLHRDLGIETVTDIITRPAVSDLHRDLGIETVTDIITRLSSSHKKRLQNHINTVIQWK